MPISLVESAAPLLAVLTPLVAVPLTVITFYLRSLREHQVSWHAAFVRRVEANERAVTELREVIGEFERDYTTKEEWLRECMMARRTLDELKEATVRMDTIMRNVIEPVVAGDRVEGDPDAPAASARQSNDQPSVPR